MALTNGGTRKIGVQFDGLLIPFGGNVSYKPISSKDAARLHQFGKQMPPEIFVRYVLRGVRGWLGGMLITDCEDLENLSASVIHVKLFKHP